MLNFFVSYGFGCWVLLLCLIVYWLFTGYLLAAQCVGPQYATVPCMAFRPLSWWCHHLIKELNCFHLWMWNRKHERKNWRLYTCLLWDLGLIWRFKIFSGERVRMMCSKWHRLDSNLASELLLEFDIFLENDTADTGADDGKHIMFIYSLSSYLYCSLST